LKRGEADQYDRNPARFGAAIYVSIARENLAEHHFGAAVFRCFPYGFGQREIVEIGGKSPRSK
jgi:hypothetical protein